MPTYAQQTDKKKAEISSIGEEIGVVKPATPETVIPTTMEQPTETPAPQIIEPTAPVEVTPAETPQTKKTGSYYKDVYLPKVEAEKAKRQGIQQVETPAPSRADTMDVYTLANAYKDGSVTAIEIENLKETDPYKYQEVKLQLERQTTLDAINQNQDDFMANYKALTQAYIDKWQAISGSDEGKTLREEVFEKYGLNESNDKIKTYTTQIDSVEKEIEKLGKWKGTGDALADRSEMLRQQRDLISQRTDLIKTRSAEIDYYRLGLDQADAVLSDYKEYQKNQLDLMDKQFEMTTGLTKMEFEAEQGQLANELADIDSYIANIATAKAADLEFERELYRDDLKFDRDLILEDVRFENELNKAMTMAEVDFQYDTQLQQLDLQSKITLSQVDAQLKLGLLRASKELDLEYPERSYQKMDDGSIIAVNSADPTDYKVVDPKGAQSYLQSIGGGKITSRGGTHDNYQGIDIDGKMGDAVPSIGGKVVNVVTGQGKSDTPSYGNYVDIEDANGNIHRYAHLSEVYVAVGDSIPQGAMLGAIGNSGYTIPGENGDGSHLDYSIKKSDGSRYKASEIPGYISTLEKPTTIPPGIMDLISEMQYLKKGSEGFKGAVGASFWQKGLGGELKKKFVGESDFGLVVGSKAEAFASRAERIINVLAFKNIDKIKGAMSDNDIKFLKSIETSLNRATDEESFNNEILRIEALILSEYGQTLGQVLDLPDFDNEEEGGESSYLVD